MKSSAVGAGLALNAGTSLSAALDLRSEVTSVQAEWNRRRRILYFSHNLKIQGAQTSLYELASAFSSDPCNDVFVMAPDEGPMKSKYENKNIPVVKYTLPVNGMNDREKYAALTKSFTIQLKDINPDIIHGNTVQTYHAITLGNRLGVPSVWNIRESENPDLHFRELSPDAHALAMEAFGSKARFVFVSKTTEAVWRTRFPQIESTVINNGINAANLVGNPRDTSRATLRAVLGLSSEEVLLYNVGTWTERKGQLDLVQALKRVDRRLWRKLKVVLIGRGRGAYNDSIVASIDMLPWGLRERVKVFDESADATARSFALGVFRAADIFIFTSRIESYPRVINEALFFGLPIITTPCFGVLEQIVPNVDGVFYEGGDIDRLAAHIEALVVNAGLRNKLGTAARVASKSRVMQFDDMIRRYRRVYEDIGMVESGYH